MKAEKLRVRVLKRHILKGIPASVCSCPIALAVREVGTQKKKVSVTFEIQVGKKYYDLPTVANRFINKFDDGEPVKPFSFTAERLSSGF
jgi:hypothetical protein